MKRKTSFALDETTLAIIAQRASEENLDKSAYLDKVVHRADFLHRAQTDNASLCEAGLSGGGRASAVTAALINHSRGQTA